jgi:hypothetical protein
MGNGVVDVTNFLFGDPRTRDWNARRHQSNILRLGRPDDMSYQNLNQWDSQKNRGQKSPLP